VYEDDNFTAIMDISPAAKGHVIVLSKEHAKNIFELPAELVGEGHKVAQKIAKAIKEVTGCDGVNILQNNEEAAGQTVFHYHIHVIPRFKEDNVNIKWPLGSPSDEELKDMAKKLAKECE
jgi:histidine triad (HIT) family protein